MIHKLHQLVWGPGLLLLLLIIGILYTLKSGCFQIRSFNIWWMETAGSLCKGRNKKHNGGITPFQTACTALAATIGTGNIAGVATALAAGGAGAIFWMWVSAVIGMATAYAETMLGIKYRYRDDRNQWVCGPMVYIEKGLNIKWLGVMYGVFCILSSLGMGSMVQSNSMSETVKYSFGIPAALTGIIVILLVFAVTAGGIGRISYVAERLVPVSAGIYILFSLIIIAMNWRSIPDIISVIWKSAWSAEAAGGGICGFAISKSVRYGISRGTFSNEAGLGTLAILHGAAENTTPQKQGMWAMFEVFFDTIVVCTMTAAVILFNIDGDVENSIYSGAALTARCFEKSLGNIGEYLVAASMLLFAFATIIAWYYLGRQAVLFLNGKIKKRYESICLSGYSMLYLAAVFTGCIAKLEPVWELSDIWNGLMAVPNLLALIFLVFEVKFPEDHKTGKIDIDNNA